MFDDSESLLPIFEVVLLFYLYCFLPIDWVPPCGFPAALNRMSEQELCHFPLWCNYFVLLPSMTSLMPFVTAITWSSWGSYLGYSWNFNQAPTLIRKCWERRRSLVNTLNIHTLWQLTELASGKYLTSSEERIWISPSVPVSGEEWKRAVEDMEGTVQGSCCFLMPLMVGTHLTLIMPMLKMYYLYFNGEESKPSLGHRPELQLWIPVNRLEIGDRQQSKVMERLGCSGVPISTAIWGNWGKRIAILKSALAKLCLKKII